MCRSSPTPPAPIPHATVGAARRPVPRWLAERCGDLGDHAQGSGLADAVTQALNTQIASGTYAQALKRWNVAEEAVPQSQTNPPGLPTLQ